MIIGTREIISVDGCCSTALVTIVSGAKWCSQVPLDRNDPMIKIMGNSCLLSQSAVHTANTLLHFHSLDFRAE